ncbi:MAG: metal ABC transporter permease [Myxococcales bacterium]|jgi:zinc/manganese transport system permease protein
MKTLGFFDVLGAPLGAVLLFAGILAYLGVHVVRRQVIFVDLALGQVAALGVLVGVNFGLAPESAGAQVFAVGFALVAAALFSLTRRRDERIPQEAIIGVVFAVASALTYIVVDHSSHGAEHVTDILTGAILWATWGQVGRAAVVVALAAAALLAAHRRLVELSGDAGGPTRATLGLDFLFFAAFGLVISATVRTAGVLPTFAMLVAPAIAGALVAKSFGRQLAVAALSSGGLGALALVATYYADLPAGPAIVAFHGGGLLLVALGLYVARAAARRRAIAHLAAGAAACALFVGAVIAGGRWLAGSPRFNPDLPATAARQAGEGGGR